MKYKKRLIIFLGFIAIVALIIVLKPKKQRLTVEISGELRKWHTITLTVKGLEESEQSFPNPFLNYRLDVTFTNGDKTYTIPGFYAADGNAANTGASKGNKWQVRFVPDKEGTWSYKVSFRTGKNLAINDSLDAGFPLASDNQEGWFDIRQSDKQGNDFRAKGRLNYVGKRYLQFEETGEYFLKWGADSPENLLAFNEFDQTPAKHKFEPHANDWKDGDPTWGYGQGKNLIGALNYLQSKGMNVVYFLTMNVMGDGNDVWPWTDRDERYRFDCSKLDQWEIFFAHAEKLGVMLHFVTQEIENQCLLDIGALDTQRKLYYRELVARFGHHLAVTWNLGEENGPNTWTMAGQTDKNRLAMGKYLKNISPYKNFEVIHTMPDDPERINLLKPFLGKPFLDGVSLQVGDPLQVHEVTKQWIKLSADSARQWVVSVDEIGPWMRGAMSDEKDPLHDTIRSNVLWGNLMGGGDGGEWYFGMEDLTCEDWRNREKLWNQSRMALDFFQKNLPFSEMISSDELTSVIDDYCFSKRGEIYTVYMSRPSVNNINLKGVDGKFSVKWFNPRSGGELMDSDIKELNGNTIQSIGHPPSDPGKDWVVLIKKI